MSRRVYLDWNATAPLRAEARAAMSDAMDATGNPSSVHAEGRAARMILEKARSQVRAAIGAADADIVFTSGATEAAALALGGRDIRCAGIEHEAVLSWARPALPTDAQGAVFTDDPGACTIQIANGETGILQSPIPGLAVVDATQAFGKIPFKFDALEADMALIAAHKLGGPKGAGALVLRRGLDIAAQLKGGGQESGRRAGTENLIGIAGFGAAAEAAQRDLDAGIWDEVAQRRDRFEDRLLAMAPDLNIFGKSAKRLPNTSYFAARGWKGETQVMAMDLAGFAVSAGSACSSGKVRASGVLAALGVDEQTATSAIRISIGPDIAAADLLRFADVWADHYRHFRTRAA